LGKYSPSKAEGVVYIYVEFDNGDANCYLGVRVPTLEEARLLCQRHIQENSEWNDVVDVCEISKEKADGLFDMETTLADKNWPFFNGEPVAMDVIVMLDSSYVRDMQTHMEPLAPGKEDDIQEDDGWRDNNASIYIATVRGVESVDAAILKVAADCGCTQERFWGVQLMHNKNGRMI
jgi:hypothetical protein